MLTLIVGPAKSGKTHIYQNKLNSLIPNPDGLPSIYSEVKNLSIDEEIKFQLMNARHSGIRYILECQKLSEIPLDIRKCAHYCICTNEEEANKYAQLVDMPNEQIFFTFNNGSQYPFIMFDRIKNSVLSHSD